MTGVPVIGKQLGCRTVFVVGARIADKQDWVLGRAAAAAVAGTAFAAAAAAAAAAAVAAAVED